MAARARTAAARVCPVCGTPDARRIVYGLPSAELFDDPEIELGGCVVSSDAPRFRCREAACGHAFGGARR